MDSIAEMEAELRRAAHTGAQLHEARMQFRLQAEEAMSAFSTAEVELEKTGCDPIAEAISASDIAFANFIAGVEYDWDEEEDYECAGARDFATPHRRRRNRLDDYRDGRLQTPTRNDFVEVAFLRVADFLNESDPAAARRMTRLALSWSEDRRRFDEEPEWARKNGVIPGAETAPSLAALLSQFGLREEVHDPRRSCALRIGALAYRRLHTASTAYAGACCAEYVYRSVIGQNLV